MAVSEIKNLLVLVSGGRSSVKMARHIQTAPKYKGFKKLYVFTNTGQEREESIQMLKDMVYYYDIPLVLLEGVYSTEEGIGVKSKVVDFDSLYMGEKIFTDMIAHVNKHKWIGLPNEGTPYCSDYLKRRVSEHFAKKIFGKEKWITAIGYRKEDMPKRVTMAELRANPMKIAPLIQDFDRPVNKYDLTYWYNKQPFRLGIPSKIGNCKICQKKSFDNIIEDIKAGATDSIDWRRRAEIEYDDRFYRDYTSIDELVRAAKSGQQTSVFNDEGEGCFCGI